MDNVVINKIVFDRDLTNDEINSIKKNCFVNNEFCLSKAIRSHVMNYKWGNSFDTELSGNVLCFKTLEMEPRDLAICKLFDRLKEIVSIDALYRVEYYDNTIDSYKCINGKLKLCDTNIF